MSTLESEAVAETPLPLWSASNCATARGADDVPAADE